MKIFCEDCVHYYPVNVYRRRWTEECHAAVEIEESPYSRRVSWVDPWYMNNDNHCPCYRDSSFL